MEGFPWPQGTLSLFVSLSSQSFPEAVIFPSPFLSPSSHTPVHIRHSLSLSQPGLIPRDNYHYISSLIDIILFYILICYDEISQASTHMHKHTQMIIDIK